jgi:hypothetical protein
MGKEFKLKAHHNKNCLNLKKELIETYESWNILDNLFRSCYCSGSVSVER